MKAPLKTILVLICCLACLNGCMRYYRTPVAQPEGMDLDQFNAQLNQLKTRVLAIEGVAEVRLGSDAAGTTTMTVIHYGKYPSSEIKSQVKAILAEKGMIKEPLSVLVVAGDGLGD